MLVVQRVLVRIKSVCLVDAHVEDVPFVPVSARLELPVAQDVRDLVTIAQRVVRWADATILAYIDSHEAIRQILCPTILGAAPDKTFHQAALGHRACKGLDQAKSVRVLPQTAFAKGPKIVQGTLFIEVVVEEKLSWWLVGLHCLEGGLLELLALWSHCVGQRRAIRRVTIDQGLQLPSIGALHGLRVACQHTW